jgi:hypothetical protein
MEISTYIAIGILAVFFALGTYRSLKTNYTRFRIEAQNGHTAFQVQVKDPIFGWKSGYIYTDYFSISYPSEEEAKEAVEGYLDRFSERGVSGS